MLIDRPEAYREGQTIFNFLEWLHREKGYEVAATRRIADTFHFDDALLDSLYHEYLGTVEPQRKETTLEKY